MRAVLIPYLLTSLKQCLVFWESRDSHLYLPLAFFSNFANMNRPLSEEELRNVVQGPVDVEWRQEQEFE